MKTKILNSIFAVFSFLLFTNSVSYSQWFQLTTNTAETLHDIYFMNENTGIAVGSNGIIIRTTDAGLTWSSITSGTVNTLYSVSFPDIMSGYSGGYTGTVLRTLNCGASWTPRTGCGINIRSISFIDVNTGITAGGGTLMCYTTDGGYSWDPRYVPAYTVTAVTFLNNSSLLACVQDLMAGVRVYKSIDGGLNWSTALTLPNGGISLVHYFNRILFVDSLTGFIAGYVDSLGHSYGYIYKTINGGNNWYRAMRTDINHETKLKGINFGSSIVGYAAGSNGVILSSTNAGVNWVAQNSGTNTDLNSVCMINEFTGYICGNSGLILKTTNGGITGFVNLNNEIPGRFSLHQNYPNPFNPTTKIKFQIPLSRAVSEGRGMFAKLIIYDILGREIAVLVNQQLQPGSYEVLWSATGGASNYPSGVYYYKITADDYSETKKMVLIK
jgi:photosystem II stability/assembly factor-like uncharacterized protein